MSEPRETTGGVTVSSVRARLTTFSCCPREWSGVDGPWRADVVLSFWPVFRVLSFEARGHRFLGCCGATTLAGPNRKHRGHKNQCIRQLECWLTIFLVLLAIVLAAAYYAYCVYGKSTRSTNKETEPLMPVATATPMT